jgi:hypothetical protein
MLFFRSEEHLRNWTDFSPETEDGIIKLSDLVTLFSISFFRRRLDPDYVSHVPEYMGEFFATLAAIGKQGPFWVP